MKRKIVRMLNYEFRKAFNTVCNDLNKNPKRLWYNKVVPVRVPLDMLEDVHQHFSHHIVIMTKIDKLDKDKKVPVSIIEVPISVLKEEFLLDELHFQELDVIDLARRLEKQQVSNKNDFLR